MHSRSTAITAFLMVALVLSAINKLAEAQQTPSCASSLVTCAPYLNTTTRPESECCNAIRQVVTTQLACLCNLYNTPGLLSGLGINSTQALNIPRRCDLPSNTNVCNTTAPPGAPNPAGGNNGRGGGNGNGVGTISWSAMPALILLWAAPYLY